MNECIILVYLIIDKWVNNIVIDYIKVFYDLIIKFLLYIDKNEKIVFVVDFKFFDVE